MHNRCGRQDARDVQARLDRELNAALKERNDEFLPARTTHARAGVGHYREVNVPAGHVKVPGEIGRLQ